jgi:Ion channel
VRNGVSTGTLACVEIQRTVLEARLNKRYRAMLRNLVIGLPTMVLCLALQAAFTFWSVRFYMGQSGRMPGRGLIAQVRPLLIAMIVMMLGNFLQIVIWGALFIWLGEFSELYQSVYHSAVNFTSLGYGDVVMSARWKLLGPLEAGNGVLMFGMTSAALMAILQQLIKAQFAAGRLD